MEKWLPGMEKDGIAVAVFPSSEGKGVLVAPARLKKDLEDELSRIE
jgi:hypothetical protein